MSDRLARVRPRAIEPDERLPTTVEDQGTVGEAGRPTAADHVEKATLLVSARVVYGR